MALFRRKGSSEAARDALRRLAREQHPSTHVDNMSAVEARGLGRHPALDDRDWAQINELLVEGDGATRRSPEPDDRLHALIQALDELRSFVRDEHIAGATHVRNCLLDVWSIAREIDPQLVGPAEALLTSLVSRDLVGADEINDLCDWTERAATGRRIRHVSG